MRIAADVIALHLQHYLELSFIEGIFPESCTITKVTPLHKKVRKLIPLITALFQFVLAFSRFNKFAVSHHKVHYEAQYGFQKNISTVYAVLDIVSALLET